MADENPRNMIASFREYLNAAFINTGFRISHLFQPDQSPAAIFPHDAFSFTILAILGLLQVKYQGKDKSPFDSHPKTISLAIACLLIYGVAYGIQLRLPSVPRNWRTVLNTETVHFCMLWAGSLSIVASASFLFPDSVRPFLFLLCFITSAGALLYRVYKRLDREHRESGNGWWQRCQRVFVTTWQHLADCFTEHRQILPLVTRDCMGGG